MEEVISLSGSCHNKLGLDVRDRSSVFANNKGADQPANPQPDQHLCYSFIGKYHI